MRFKTIIYFSFLFYTTMALSQDRLVTKKGIIKFEASVPSFEEIKAKNENVSCILNTSNGEIASLALIKGFRFKIALMEEHFNENYIESDQHPKATFKGKIQNFNLNKISETASSHKMSGTLEIKGKSKTIETIALIKKTPNGIELQSKFEVSTEYFGIEIPNIVSNKVSKKVKIETLFMFSN